VNNQWHSDIKAIEDANLDAQTKLVAHVVLLVRNYVAEQPAPIKPIQDYTIEDAIKLARGLP
jgi:hypothetical protein